MEIPSTGSGYYRPVVVRLNSTGDFAWATTVNTPSSNHIELQGIGVRADGSVDVLMRTQGESQLGGIESGVEGLHFLLAGINSTGSWTNATEIVGSELGSSSTDFDSYDSALMDITPSGNLVLAIFTVEDANNLTIGNESLLFEDACSDSMVLLSLRTGLGRGGLKGDSAFKPHGQLRVILQPARNRPHGATRPAVGNEMVERERPSQDNYARLGAQHRV